MKISIHQRKIIFYSQDKGFQLETANKELGHYGGSMMSKNELWAKDLKV